MSKRFGNLNFQAALHATHGFPDVVDAQIEAAGFRSFGDGEDTMAANAEYGGLVGLYIGGAAANFGDERSRRTVIE